MQDTIQTIRHELDTLLDEGFALFTEAVQGRQSDQALPFMKKHASYQSWYAKALRVIRQLYPELTDDFQVHYRALRAMHRTPTSPAWYRKALRLMHTWTGQRAHDATDHVWEGPYGTQAASEASVRHAGMEMAIPRNSETMVRVRMTFLTRLHQQLSMLNAVRNGLEYVLADLQSTLYGEVGDHIQATAYELFRRGQPRAAGALAGMLLELHLAKVATEVVKNLLPEDPSEEREFAVDHWQRFLPLSEIRQRCRATRYGQGRQAVNTMMRASFLAQRRQRS